MFSRFVLITVSVVGFCAAAEPALSPEARALISPVFDTFARVESAQATLPPPINDSERLVRMGEVDQAGRAVLQQVDLSSLPADQADAAYLAMWSEIGRRDLVHQAAVKAMIPTQGWFTRSAYGQAAANAAFLIIQHATNDTELQQKALAAMEPLVPKGEVSGEAFGMLYDRRAMMDGRRQRYGSQLVCQGGKRVLYPVEELASVDERRRAAGFALNLAQNLARFENLPPCVGTYEGPIPQ